MPDKDQNNQDAVSDPGASLPAEGAKGGRTGGISLFTKIIIGMIALLVVFGLGLALGKEHSKFRDTAENNYLKNLSNFGMGPGMDAGGKHGKDGISPMNPHNSRGIIGTIIDIADEQIIIERAGDLELIIEVDDESLIKKDGKNIRLEELQIGDGVAVIGHPEDGEGKFEAKLIRVVDLPPLPGAEMRKDMPGLMKPGGMTGIVPHNFNAKVLEVKQSSIIVEDPMGNKVELFYDSDTVIKVTTASSVDALSAEDPIIYTFEPAIGTSPGVSQDAVSSITILK